MTTTFSHHSKDPKPSSVTRQSKPPAHIHAGVGNRQARSTLGLPRQPPALSASSVWPNAPRERRQHASSTRSCRRGASRKGRLAVQILVERDVFADAVAWTARALPTRPTVPVL